MIAFVMLLSHQNGGCVQGVRTPMAIGSKPLARPSAGR